MIHDSTPVDVQSVDHAIFVRSWIGITRLGRFQIGSRCSCSLFSASRTHVQLFLLLPRLESYSTGEASDGAGEGILAPIY